MARRIKRRRKTTTRRRAPARRRRAPMRRRAARRHSAPVARRRAAPAKRRRSIRRRNPKGIWTSPAFKYAAAAGAGAGVAKVALPMIARPAWLPAWLSLDVVAAALTAFVLPKLLKLKGSNRQLAIAAGVGMVTPRALDYVGTMTGPQTTQSKLLSNRSIPRTSSAMPSRTRAPITGKSTDLL